MAEQVKMKIEDVLKRLNECKIAYETAYKEADEAVKLKLTALGELNRAQKDLDVVVAEMRKAAPSESDWRRNNTIRHVVNEDQAVLSEYEGDRP